MVLLPLLIFLYQLMSHINPLMPTKNQPKHKHTNTKKTHHLKDEQSLSILSNSQSQTSHISASQSISSSQRNNQIKPKLKISFSRSSTLNSNTDKAQNQQLSQSSPTKTAVDLTATRIQVSIVPKSIQYSTIKPFFNWNKLAFLCGGGEELGEHGCLCGNVCPWRQEWIKDRERLDYRVFQKLLEQKATKEHLGQIEKDIPRTHPECPTFSKNVMFGQMLRNVLVAYSVYDMEIGYVQGVNMIAGVLLYHIKNQSLAFWALVNLMEVQELRQIYLSGFYYLKEHTHTIITIVQHQVNDLHYHMGDLDIMPECFLNGWLLSLMSTAIPMEYMAEVLERFRKQGWKFIYKLVVTYLLYLKDFLLTSRDQGEFLSFLSNKSSRQLGVQWMEVISTADKLKL